MDPLCLPAASAAASVSGARGEHGLAVGCFHGAHDRRLCGLEGQTPPHSPRLAESATDSLVPCPLIHSMPRTVSASSLGEAHSTDPNDCRGLAIVGAGGIRGNERCAPTGAAAAQRVRLRHRAGPHRVTDAGEGGGVRAGEEEGRAGHWHRRASLARLFFTKTCDRTTSSTHP